MPRYVNIPVVMLMLATASASADVYKYVDERGMTIFSTVPLPGKTPIAVIGAQSSLPPPPSAPRAHDQSPRAPAGGGVYKYRDDEGNIVISTVPLPGKTPIAVIPVEPSPASPSSSSPSVANSAGGNSGYSSGSGSSGSAYGSSGGSEPSFKVSSQTQRGRDDLRRTILQDELAQEQRLLSTAESTYRDGQPIRLPEESANASLFDDRVRRLADAIRIHRSNIAALQRELSRIK